MAPGAAEQPVEPVRPVIQGEVPRVWHEHELGPREAGGEVLAMGVRDEHVQVALPEPHLGRHVGELEAPGLREGEVVVDPAAASLADARS